MKLFNKLLDFKNYSIKTKILMPFVIICVLVGLGIGSYIVSTKMYSSKSDITKKEALVSPKDDAKKNINTTNSTNSTVNDSGQNNAGNSSNNVGNNTISNSPNATNSTINSTDNRTSKSNTTSTPKQSTEQPKVESTKKIENTQPKQEVADTQQSQPVSKPTSKQSTTPTTQTQPSKASNGQTNQPIQQAPTHGNKVPNYNPNQKDNSVGGGVDKERMIAELQQQITIEKHIIDRLQGDPRGQDHQRIKNSI